MAGDTSESLLLQYADYFPGQGMDYAIVDFHTIPLALDDPFVFKESQML